MSDQNNMLDHIGNWQVWTAIAAFFGVVGAYLRGGSSKGTMTIVTELVELLKSANETIAELRDKIEKLEKKVDELSAQLSAHKK
jgi:uncharacterized protein YlxW (UPF0749 family)